MMMMSACRHDFVHRVPKCLSDNPDEDTWACNVCKDPLIPHKRIAELEKAASRYQFMRNEESWGEGSGEDCWNRLGESTGFVFDDIVDRRMSDSLLERQAEAYYKEWPMIWDPPQEQ